MRKVANAVGISATAIYRHYENKEFLLMAVCDEGFHRFGQYLYRGLLGTTPIERLELSGLSYVDFALEQPEYYEVMFMSSPRQIGLERLKRRTQAEVSPTFQFLVDRVRECMDTGYFVPGDPVIVAMSIWAHCHGLVSLYLNEQLGPVREDSLFRQKFSSSIKTLTIGFTRQEN